MNIDQNFRHQLKELIKEKLKYVILSESRKNPILARSHHACAAFIFNTTEFVPVALLTDIGQSFDMQSSDVGLMMTVYAWTVMIMSLPAMLATGDMERKGLLLKLFVIFIIGHIISVIAWNYWILLIARMCIAVAHSLFWQLPHH